MLHLAEILIKGADAGLARVMDDVEVGFLVIPACKRSQSACCLDVLYILLRGVTYSNHIAPLYKGYELKSLVVISPTQSYFASLPYAVSPRTKGFPYGLT